MLRQWATWVTALGLPDELYWESSPREIDACFVEYYRMQDTENSRVGTVAASIFNSVPGDSKQASRRKWLDWTNFFKPLTSQRKIKDKAAALAEAQAMWHANMDARDSIRKK